MPRTPSRSVSRSRSPAKIRRSPDLSGENECPFLIRVFVTKGKHTPMVDFDEGRFPIRDEFSVYGWNHSTPTSLVQLLYPSFPQQYRSPLARFSFRHIYVDASNRGLYRSRDLVSFSGRDLMASLPFPPSSSSDDPAASSSETTKPKEVAMDMELDDLPERNGASRVGGGGRAGKKVEEKTLEEYGFITGDLLSVNLYVPEPKGAAVAGRAGASILGPGATPVAVPISGAGPRGGDREAHPSDRGGAWARGEALPPQHAVRGGGGGGGGPAGNWRGGAPGQIGIRGAGRAGRRSRSPDVRRDGGDVRNGHGRARSRSPGGAREGRRESWASRKRD